VLLSINRFERKKGLALALRCLAELRRGGDDAAPLHLVQAGGFDPRLAENVEHLQELLDEAEALGLADAVTFVPSFSDEQKAALLAAATMVLYTPQVRLCNGAAPPHRVLTLPLCMQHEHFGLVPLEAMAAQRAVIACNSGGPTESIVDGVTGFLCEPTPAAFAAAARRLLDDTEGVRRVRPAFCICSALIRLAAQLLSAPASPPAATWRAASRAQRLAPSWTRSCGSSPLELIRACNAQPHCTTARACRYARSRASSACSLARSRPRAVMVGLVAGRAATALTLSRLLQPLGSIAAQQSTLATAPSVAQAIAPEATAAAPAAALRSFYKRQLPRDLVAFSSAEARRMLRAALPPCV
jgi:hypothetical protein